MGISRHLTVGIGSLGICLCGSSGISVSGDIGDVGDVGAPKKIVSVGISGDLSGHLSTWGIS